MSTPEEAVSRRRKGARLVVARDLFLELIQWHDLEEDNAAAEAGDPPVPIAGAPAGTYQKYGHDALSAGYETLRVFGLIESDEGHEFLTHKGRLLAGFGPTPDAPIVRGSLSAYLGLFVYAHDRFALWTDAEVEEFRDAYVEKLEGGVDEKGRALTASRIEVDEKRLAEAREELEARKSPAAAIADTLDAEEAEDDLDDDLDDDRDDYIDLDPHDVGSRRWAGERGAMLDRRYE